MKEKPNKALIFLRRNAVYLILALCIVAVGLSIMLMATTDPNSNGANLDDIPVVNQPSEPDKPDQPEEPDTPTITEPVDLPVEFISPVENPTSVSEYTDQMVFNPTLNRYGTHMAIDFFAPEGTEVLAVYDGTILLGDLSYLRQKGIYRNHK